MVAGVVVVVVVVVVDAVVVVVVEDVLGRVTRWLGQLLLKSFRQPPPPLRLLRVKHMID